MRHINAASIPTSVSYDEATEICRKLKLVEIMQHGDKEYIRFTQKGYNVAAALLQMLMDTAGAEQLKGS